MNQLHYGVCYFPEHWPARDIATDVKRIADCGFTYVRIGEGAWWYFEPREGQYQFDLFDQTIDECRKHGLKVVFGTPTYCGPAWIGHQYPEVYRWDFQRTPMKHGSRRNYNYTSEKYLDLSDKIVTALANQYKSEKQIIAWQIDNEFNCHMDVSYAPSDTQAFRVWLKKKYRSLDQLNAAWGTKFWSQVYDAWEQIDLPHPTATYHNPTQLLDESRFISDTVVAYCARQKSILNSVNPKWPLTHNGIFSNVDGMKLMQQLDFFSHDQYPMFQDEWTKFASPLVAARAYSFPFAIMEQQAGPGGQMGYLLRSGKPNEMRLWAHQSFAHGAKALSYFCWKTCPFGSEQHWHGLLDHDGKDNGRIDEAKQVGKEIFALPKEIWDAPPQRCVAIVRDYDNEINDRRINTYVKQGAWDAGHWMSALFRLHVPTDQVWPSSDWNGYRVLIAPHLKMIDQQMVVKFDEFVRAGGMLVIGAQSGIKNRNLHMVQQTPPGLLRKLAGVEVEDWTTLQADETRELAFSTGQTLSLRGFVEKLRLRGAEAIANWTCADDLLANAPAITIHTVGKGKVVYIAGYCADDAAKTLSQWLIEQITFTPIVEADPNVELIIREGKRHDYLWFLNHSGETQFIVTPPGLDLITQQPVETKVKLEPRGVAIVEIRKQPKQ